MRQLEEQFAALASWGTLSEPERRSLCEQIIVDIEQPSCSPAEVAGLARGLAASGETLSWPTSIQPRGDVASTGGPASLTTLLCPYLLAACGCYVPKVSVPGSTAGAIDVLALVPGMRTQLSGDDMLRTLQGCHIAHSISTGFLAPADGYLFRLRSQAGKKAVPGLVIASLLSKKVAVSCTSSAVDVRCGKGGNLGAEPSVCEQNARLYASAATILGISVSCVITNNDEPPTPLLGRSESLAALLAILRGENQSAWIREHVDTNLSIAAEALFVAGYSHDPDKCRELVEKSLSSGAALAAFEAHVDAQGGSIRGVQDCIESCRASARLPVRSKTAGYVAQTNLRALARALRKANQHDAGRDRVGVSILKRRGDAVAINEPLAEVRVADNAADNIEGSLMNTVASAFGLVAEPVLVSDSPSTKMIHAVIRGKSHG